MAAPAAARPRAPVSMRLMMKIGFAGGIGLAVCAVFAEFVFVFAVSWLAPAEPHVSTSPDRMRRVVVTQRTTMGGIDPPVELTVALESATSGELLDRVRVGVDEDSDVGTPAVRWQDDTAVVTGLELHHNVTVTLRFSGSRQ